MDALTQNLIAAARRKGITLRDAARRAGVDQSTVTKWHSGASPSGRLYNKVLAAIDALPSPPEVPADGVKNNDHAGTVADRAVGVSESFRENPSPRSPQNDNDPAAARAAGEGEAA